MMKDSIIEFVDREIWPHKARFEQKDYALTEELMKKAGELKEDLIQFVEDRLGHDKRYSLDSSKLMALGWKPHHSFETALKETINWYKENSQWWEPLKTSAR